ncbi:hypothetical protein [Mesorhizobium sp. AR02]|uniref:hypothetical protein n=1 Tax=Mesorhizobium sp. AR02 TaxID=2865837 RepID=UPI002962000B|nr:hypothetical protein [Mesorhizobium sp. AR02]
MKDEARERRRNLLWGIPASLILHVLVAVILIYGLPIPPQQPQEEQPVNVAIVPPPDQPKPKPAPVPPPKPPEPKVEKPPEPKVEKPPPPENQAQKLPPVEALKPVFQFGDKDTGPRKSLDGASAQDSSPSPAKDDKPPVEPKPAENQPATPADPTKADQKPVTATADAKPTQSDQKQTTQDTDKQQAAKQEAEKQGVDAAKQQGAVPEPLVADGGDGEIELPMSAVTPQPKPAKCAEAQPFKSLEVCISERFGLSGCSQALLAGRYRRCAGDDLDG